MAAPQRNAETCKKREGNTMEVTLCNVKLQDMLMWLSNKLANVTLPN